MRLESEQVIARPPEAVFDFLADARNEVHWNEWAKRIDKLSEGPVARGTRFHGSIKNFGELDFELSEYARPHRLQQYNRTSSGEFRHTYVLEPVTGGTRVWQQGVFEPRGWRRFVAPLMFPLMWRHVKQMERGLKQRLEGGDTASPTGA